MAQLNDGECLSSKYENERSVLEWKCGTCGCIWSTTYNSIQHGSWCPRCSHNEKRTIEDAQKVAEEYGGKCISTEYINSSSKLKWICSKGHPFEADLSHVLYGDRWCPKCNRPGKKIREKLEYILSLLYPHFDIGINKRNIPWLIGPGGGKLEVDFLLKDDNLTIALEYDGPQHFRPIAFGRDKNGTKNTKTNFEYIQKCDRLKDQLIAAHPDEITHFVRIPYTVPLTIESIREFLQQNGVQC
jgi:hypothetical protein